MSDPAHVPAILQEPRRVRYLKIIALFKIFKGVLRATGILALFYCGVLFTEGIGVYMQKRWAEFLMIFATGALIPLEMRHVWHRLIFDRPIFAPILLLLGNCFIVWFLYLVLRRDKLEKHTAPKPELIESR